MKKRKIQPLSSEERVAVIVQHQRCINGRRVTGNNVIEHCLVGSTLFVSYNFTSADVDV